jgi:hypothetical protein
MACTYCPTSRACKCTYNCANCFKAKELYSQILTDVHNSQVDYTIIRQVKTILPNNESNNESNNVVHNACVDKTQDFQQEVQKKEKRKTERQQVFKERQKK